MMTSTVTGCDQMTSSTVTIVLKPGQTVEQVTAKMARDAAKDAKEWDKWTHSPSLTR
jgi:hypothetical protein